jgi:Kef-type K+ transport system membrane component KefB
VDRDTFSALAVIAAVAVIAPLVSECLKGRVPGVVLEIGLGIVIGPQVLSLAKVTPVVDGLAGIGLTFLFFMAG